jgi:hypothetical protein
MIMMVMISINTHYVFRSVLTPSSGGIIAKVFTELWTCTTTWANIKIITIIKTH